jgi:hypothetical protein
MRIQEGKRSFFLKTFQPLYHPILAKQYQQCHEQALRDFGVEGVDSCKMQWWKRPKVYCLVLFDESNKMVAGMRVEIAQIGYPLPLEAAIQEKSPELVEEIRQKGGTFVELCGAWVAPRLRKHKLFKHLLHLGLGLIKHLQIPKVIALPPKHTKPLFDQLGFELWENEHQETEYIYPDPRYVSTLMQLDLKNLGAIKNPMLQERIHEFSLFFRLELPLVDY